MSKFEVGDTVKYVGMAERVIPKGHLGTVAAIHKDLPGGRLQIEGCGEYWFPEDVFISWIPSMDEFIDNPTLSAAHFKKVVADEWKEKMESVKYRGEGKLKAEFDQRIASIQNRLDQDAKYEAAAEADEKILQEGPFIRQFNTGATRNLDKSKLDYEGFLSPLALKAFAEYMHSHRQQKDDTFRDSDNWQKGIPHDVYVKSLFRHFFDLWSLHRGGAPISPDSGLQVDQVEALCAMMFNVQGLLHELLKEQSNGR